MQIRMTGLAATAAETLAAATAPSWTSGSDLAGDRFHTVTPCPAVTRHRASADPMRPSPRAEMSVMNDLLAVANADSALRAAVGISPCYRQYSACWWDGSST